MNYTQGNREYHLDYQSLKNDFNRISSLNDEQFLENLPNILHLTVFVCWFKGLSSNVVLADDGIVHQLVHLLTLRDEPLIMGNLKEIRQLFNEQIALV